MAIIDDVLALRKSAFYYARRIGCYNPTLFEDLWQETCLRVFENAHQFEEGSNLKSWVFTIFRNVHIAQWRKRRHETEDVNDLAAEKVAIEPMQYSHLLAKDMAGLLDKLPTMHRKVITLIMVDGKTYEEAAVIIGRPVGTVKSRANRGRDMLCSMLEGYQKPKPLQRQQGKPVMTTKGNFNSRKEAAKAFGISPRTAHDRIRKGEWNYV